MSKLCKAVRCKWHEIIDMVYWWFNRLTVKQVLLRNTPTKWESCVLSDWIWRLMDYTQRGWGLGRKSTAPRVSCPNVAWENMSLITGKCNILSFNLQIFVLGLIQYNFFHNKSYWVKQYNSAMEKSPREQWLCIYLQIPPVEERLYVNVRSWRISVQ